jgi:threonine synthase
VLVCSQCGQPFPETGLPFRCEHCGGDYEATNLPEIDFSSIEEDQPGIWKYRHTFHGEDLPVVSMGEGNTPLISLDRTGNVLGKMELLNPTGSYKDRAMSLIISQVLKRGGQVAVEDSSGNAGASFSAYSARAGIKGRVYVPASTDQAKVNQISIYGADVIQIEGPRAAAADAVMAEAEKGAIYASHAYLPFGLRGIATIAYELFLQLDQKPPGCIFVPTGHGHLLRGIIDGFLALQAQGYIDLLPHFVGVQADRCAPIATAWINSDLKVARVPTQHTVAEGTAVTMPRQGNVLLALFASGLGEFVTVSEDEIMEAFHALAHQGVYVEPTSAMVWAAFQNYAKECIKNPTVLILTGNGLKYTIVH